jgi:hypothetical protein
MLGGASAVGSLFGIRSQSVSGWGNLSEVPSNRRVVLESLFPLIFPGGHQYGRDVLAAFGLIPDDVGTYVKKCLKRKVNIKNLENIYKYYPEYKDIVK